MIGGTNVGSSSGEVHGASIQVTTEESTLIGKACDLKLGNVITQSKVFNASGAVLFTDIQEVGEYTVYASDGVESRSYGIIVTANDIVSKNILELDYKFSEPLPIASVGEIIQIGGKNCMCIGTNRYLYLYNIGSTTWSGAKNSASNWNVPTNITDLYDVSDKMTITEQEAYALTESQRVTIYNSAGDSNGVWTSSLSAGDTHYRIWINSSGRPTGDNEYSGNPDSHSRACLPAFTVSRKS